MEEEGDGARMLTVAAESSETRGGAEASGLSRMLIDVYETELEDYFDSVLAELEAPMLSWPVQAHDCPGPLPGLPRPGQRRGQIPKRIPPGRGQIPKRIPPGILRQNQERRRRSMPVLVPRTLRPRWSLPRVTELPRVAFLLPRMRPLP